MMHEPGPPDSLRELAGDYLGAGIIAGLALGVLAGLAAPRGVERRLGRLIGPALSLVEYLARNRS